jgi:hypothetical protein
MEYRYVRIIDNDTERFPWVKINNAVGRVVIITTETTKYASGMAHQIVSSEFFGAGLGGDMFVESTEEDFDKQEQLPLTPRALKTIALFKEFSELVPIEPVDLHKRKI